LGDDRVEEVLLGDGETGYIQCVLCHVADKLDIGVV
jgi:hypothetical protein